MTPLRCTSCTTYHPLWTPPPTRRSPPSRVSTGSAGGRTRTPTSTRFSLCTIRRGRTSSPAPSASATAARPTASTWRPVAGEFTGAADEFAGAGGEFTSGRCGSLQVPCSCGWELDAGVGVAVAPDDDDEGSDSERRGQRAGTWEWGTEENCYFAADAYVVRKMCVIDVHNRCA
eukprot:1185564-Prorocentrum_minimum.AAC.1